MSSDVMEQLKQLSNAERLQVIEAATRLIRDDLAEPALSAREEQDRRLRRAALAAKDLYDGDEMTEWTRNARLSESLDSEEFLDANQVLRM